MYFDFDPFWRTLKSRKMTKYRLIHTYLISPGQLDRMRKNQHVSTHTIEQFCRLLCCGISDVIEMRADDDSLIADSLLGIPLPCMPANEAAEAEAAAAALPPSGLSEKTPAALSVSDRPGGEMPALLRPIPEETKPLPAAVMPPYPTSYQATQDIRLVYRPFWNTLVVRDISQYHLSRALGVSSGQLDRMRKNEYITTRTILRFCRLLNCSFCDIIELQDKNGTAFPPSVLAEETPEPAEQAPEPDGNSDISDDITGKTTTLN